MRMLKLAAGLVLAVCLAVPVYAQGLGGGPTNWTVGSVDLSWHRTSNSLTGYTGEGSGKIYGAAGAQVGTFRDSAYIVRANTAGNMQFDTTATFSLSTMKDWTQRKASLSEAAVAGDSVWVCSLLMYPVNDGFTATLGAGTTGGGATITADSLKYYQEVSMDGGINWVRTISLLADIPEFSTTNAFYHAFNSQIPTAESGTLGPANFFEVSGGAKYRFVLVHDSSGKYGLKLLYPKAVR